jgi:hypothetical protein
MLILLDIDGVMVPACSWKRPEFLEDGFPTFSTRAINALQKIISVKGADIVLTTSHKNSYSLAEWKSVFERRGLNISNISRLPSNSLEMGRKDELLQWYHKNPNIESFVIIDDDKSLNDLPNSLKENLIQPSPMVGLTEELAEKAVDILTRQEMQEFA